MDPEKKYHITVSAKAFYVEDQSDPEKNHYVFGYTIRVINTGTVEAKLISRHWVITDSNHRIEEVRGLGVVGQQPALAPGQAFEYTSGVSARDSGGDDAWRIPDDGCRWRPVRSADSGVHAIGPTRPALDGPNRLRSRGIIGPAVTGSFRASATMQ